MSIMKITLLGMYQFDRSLFDDLTFPESELLDRDTAINRILLDCGEFEPLYPDWDFLKFAIGEFGKKWFYTFKKWIEALEVEYNPLENYNKIEQWNIDSQRDISSSGDTHLKHRTYDNGTMTETDNTSSSNKGNDKAVIARDGVTRGNIGVTTSQQMLESSLELYRGFNLYEEIANIFKTELIVMVYE